MSVFGEDDSPNRLATIQGLDMIRLLHHHLHDFLFSVVSAVRSICGDYVDSNLEIREKALEVLTLLIRHHQLGDQVVAWCFAWLTCV